VTLAAAISLAALVGVGAASAALEVPRATLYRRRRPRVVREPAPRPTPPRRLPDDERDAIVALLTSDRFVDLAPAQVWAQLIDEGQCPCSIRTMYRVLDERELVRERRAITRHPAPARPELVARAPNQVWSWDITKLRGPAKGIWYFLYVVLDIFSRYVVGWMLARSEGAALAAELIDQTCSRHGIAPGQVQLHNDRGSPMTSLTFAQKLDELGVARSLSRPRVSNDNPFSEAQFKTAKYHPSYPGRFVSVEHGRDHFEAFLGCYNDEHRHSGLALLTPADVHHGRAADILAARQLVLDGAYAAHPERFPAGPPRVRRPPIEVWINPPEPKLINNTGTLAH